MNKSALSDHSTLHPMFANIFDLHFDHSTTEKKPQRRKCWTPYCSDCRRCLEEGLQEIVDREG